MKKFMNFLIGTFLPFSVQRLDKHEQRSSHKVELGDARGSFAKDSNRKEQAHRHVQPRAQPVQLDRVEGAELLPDLHGAELYRVGPGEASDEDYHGEGKYLVPVYC